MSAKHRRGYTMIEVMMALAILAIGAAGVVAMEKAAVVGNASAKSIATATALATRWAERLHADSMVWNTLTPLSDIGETRWLLTAVTTPNTWVLPTPIPGKVSPYADPLGADIVIVNDPAAVAYCTHISYRFIGNKMVSAAVRTSYRRDNSPIDCNAIEMSAALDPGKYGVVTVTIGLEMQERL